ncbi:SMI1/KNR4 family protein [Streptomyces sp. NPDC005167]
MNSETCVPAELVALRSIFASRREAAPAAGWDAVWSFEAEHGIVLPEPYRTFVAEVCDGLRAGPPHYGLLPLAENPRDWGSDRPERLLAEPFPLTAAWLWEVEEEAVEETALAMQEFEARLAPVFDHGSLLLGTDGCGMYWHLIVTGPQRGHVWLIAGEGALPFGTQSPNAPMSGVPGFTGWATHWAQGRDWFSGALEDDAKRTG